MYTVNVTPVSGFYHKVYVVIFTQKFHVKYVTIITKVKYTPTCPIC